MEQKDHIKRKLEAATQLLWEAANMLQKVNETTQLDYVTDSELSSKYDRAAFQLVRIEKIVYQKS